MTCRAGTITDMIILLLNCWSPKSLLCWIICVYVAHHVMIYDFLQAILKLPNLYSFPNLFQLTPIVKSRLPHSMEKNDTHPGSPVWKWPPFFMAKKQTFQLKTTHFFAIKHWLFSPKWPLFLVKTLTCPPKWTTLFIVKHWTSKLTNLSPNSLRWVPKYPLFLGKFKSWISSKNTPLFENFRSRMCVVK